MPSGVLNSLFNRALTDSRFCSELFGDLERVLRREGVRGTELVRLLQVRPADLEGMARSMHEGERFR